MLKTPEAYKNTSVSVARTRKEITAILRRYGADGIAWQTVWKADRNAMALRFKRAKRVYRFQVDLGSKPQQVGQRMRALYWGLKAMLEQAEFGILKFEDVFLAYSEVALKDGSTVNAGEIIRVQLDRLEIPSLERGPLALPPARIEGQ